MYVRVWMRYNAATLQRFCTDPSAQQGVAALLQLQVGGQIGPDDVGRVEALPQLGAALEDEVDDEELDACVHG